MCHQPSENAENLCFRSNRYEKFLLNVSKQSKAEDNVQKHFGPAYKQSFNDGPSPRVDASYMILTFLSPYLVLQLHDAGCSISCLHGCLKVELI